MKKANLINKEISDKEYLLALADNLDHAARSGMDRDEPEGTRIIMMSDTLAKLISASLRKIADSMK